MKLNCFLYMKQKQWSCSAHVAVLPYSPVEKCHACADAPQFHPCFLVPMSHCTLQSTLRRPRRKTPLLCPSLSESVCASPCKNTLTPQLPLSAHSSEAFRHSPVHGDGSSNNKCRFGLSSEHNWRRSYSVHLVPTHFLPPYGYIGFVPTPVLFLVLHFLLEPGYD